METAKGGVRISVMPLGSAEQLAREKPLKEMRKERDRWTGVGMRRDGGKRSRRRRSRGRRAKYIVDSFVLPSQLVISSAHSCAIEKGRKERRESPLSFAKEAQKKFTSGSGAPGNT